MQELGFLSDFNFIVNNIFYYREMIIKKNNIIDDEVDNLKGLLIQNLSKLFIPIHDLHSLYAVNRNNLIIDNKNNLDILEDLINNKQEVL